MSQKTGIQWTDRSSNPLRYRDAAGNDVWACVKKSAGCANCYAEATALRFGKGTGFTAANMRKLAPYVREKEMKELLSPKKTPAGSKVFVCDMTDLFGDWVPFELADRLFAAFALRPDVVFQVLTKRPDRMADYLTATDLDERLYAVVSGWLDDGAKGLLGREWDRCHAVTEDATEDDPRPDAARWRLPLPNVWLGTSVENQAAADERIPHLLKVPARVRFLSCEPLLGPVTLPLLVGCRRCNHPGNVLPRDGCPRCGGTGHESGLHWVIVGGESGAGARPMLPDWARSVRDQCQAAGVAFHFKQWGEFLHVHPREVVPGKPFRTVDDTGADASFFTPGAFVLQRLGVKTAGRMLDGREWDEFPTEAGDE